MIKNNSNTATNDENLTKNMSNPCVFYEQIYIYSQITLVKLIKEQKIQPSFQP